MFEVPLRTEGKEHVRPTLHICQDRPEQKIQGRPFLLLLSVRESFLKLLHEIGSV
jgi:hypothetical protein